MLLCAKKNDDGGLEFVGMTQAVEKEKWFKGEFQPGRYIAYVSITLS
jgi:hypothetical protein